jgi:pyrrolidone-carboxylate peptidase
MPHSSPVGAIYDPLRSSKRDLVVLVAGFGDSATTVDNPASAVAWRVDGELRSVTNDWGNTVHVRIVGVGNVQANFMEDLAQGHGSSLRQSEVQSSELKRMRSGGGAMAQRMSGPAFVAANIETTHPDVVITLGVDPHDNKIRVEREAHNITRLDYGAHATNSSFETLATVYEFANAARPKPERKIEAYLHNGDAFQTLESRLPVARIVDAITRKGLGCHDGKAPGNQAADRMMWEVLGEIDQPRNGAPILRGGFIHLPTAIHSRPVVRMIDCILEACLETAKVIPEHEWG